MLLGFALTQHCNLHCPHCIRDDVATVRSLPAALVLRVVDEARELFGTAGASFTGGEPTLHHDWRALVSGLAERDVPYWFVTNAWHLKRMMPVLDRWPPQAVRLSLSGASEEIHDAERGRGSFRRVLIGIALLTSRRIPAVLSIVIDRRDRHEIRAAADLAESLGCTGIHFILPQPVPASVARDSDLAPDEWLPVRREVLALVREPGRRTAVVLDFGAPVEPGEAEATCDTMALKRLYVDAHGRVSLCCQLSEYGFNETDVVGNLNDEPLRAVYARYLARMTVLTAANAAASHGGGLAPFPCLRCAAALGKLAWLERAPASAWDRRIGVP